MDKQTKNEFEKLARMTKREFDNVYKRFDNIDKRFEGVDKRFDKIETKITDIAKQMFTKQDSAELDKKIDAIIDKLESMEQNKLIADYREQKKDKWLAVITAVLYKQKLLDDAQLEQILKE